MQRSYLKRVKEEEKEEAKIALMSKERQKKLKRKSPYNKMFDIETKQPSACKK